MIFYYCQHQNWCYLQVISDYIFSVTGNLIACNTVAHISSYISLHHDADSNVLCRLINWNSALSLLGPKARLKIWHISSIYSKTTTVNRNYFLLYIWKHSVNRQIYHCYYPKSVTITTKCRMLTSYMNISCVAGHERASRCCFSVIVSILWILLL
jgi:hypothetical protein